MAKESGTLQSKLQLDGEQQYKKALNDAYRSLRVLKSELKAETAELGKNATAQEKNSKKADSLRKQIAEQEKIVQTLSQALKDSQEQYADNQEVQDKWAEKLNKAREALAKMKEELGTATSGLGDVSDELKEVSQETANASVNALALSTAFNNIGDLAKGIGGNLEGIASSVYSTIEEMVNGMINLMSKAWAVAGEWDQIQSMYGGSIESIEKVYRGYQLQGMDTSQITSGVQKLLQNSDSAEAAAALKKIHAEEKDYNSHWEHYVAVMEKLEMYKGQDRDDLVRAIFGDKAGSTQLDMVNNWQEAMNKYQTDIEGTGMVLGEGQIQELNSISHQVDEIEALWNHIQENMGAKLSEILNVNDIDQDVLEILKDLGTLLNSDNPSPEITMKLDADVKQLISDIEAGMTNLSTYINTLSSALKDSDSPILQFIGKLLDSLGGILDWVAAHGDQIIALLEKMLPVWATNKVTEAVTGKGIGDWVTDIGGMLLQGLGLKKLFSAGGTAGAAAAGGGAATAGWLSGLFDPIRNFLTGTASKGAATVTGAGNLFPVAGDFLLNQTEIGRALRDGNDVMAAATATWERFTEKFGEKNMNDFAENWNPNSENANVIAKGAGWLYDQWAQNGANTAQFWSQIGQDVSGFFGDMFRITEAEEDPFGEAQLNVMQNMEDLYLQSLELDRGMADSIANLQSDKYTGEKEETTQEITIEVTANSYIDGDLVAQQIDRKMFSGGGGGSWRAMIQ